MRKAAKLLTLTYALCLFLGVLNINRAEAISPPDKKDISGVNWVFGSTTGTALDFYYAPDLTVLSPQGRLETWVKMVEKKGDKPIRVTVSHEFINPEFDKYKTTESYEYDINGKIISGGYDFSAAWRDIPPATPFEDTLAAALKYIKNK